MGEAITLTGTELGEWHSMKELRKSALIYAERFVGQSFTNVHTGHSIHVGKMGVKHTLAGAQDSLIKSVPAIPALLEKSSLIKTEIDKGLDRNVLAVESYGCRLELAGIVREVILTIKLSRDGRRYYDHGLID